MPRILRVRHRATVPTPTDTQLALLIRGSLRHAQANKKAHLEKSTPEYPSPDEFEFVRQRLEIFLLLLVESSALAREKSFSSAGTVNPNPLSSSPESLSTAFGAAWLPPPPLLSVSNGARFVFFFIEGGRGDQTGFWFRQNKNGVERRR